MADDEHLAYGEYHGSPSEQENERGLVGDAFRKLKRNDGLSSLLKNVHETVHALGTELGSRVSGQKQSVSQNEEGYYSPSLYSHHRFGSFASHRDGNNVKWYVDGCSYMWAVSVAIQQAKESIWILDWWLSPELYLRRPPSRNQQFRIDRLLQAAAQRGVKINVIVYKEVTQALTHPVTSFLTKLGVAVTFSALETVEEESPLIQLPVQVSSHHTKATLENLHPNIAVFRHPDHLPDSQTLQSSFISSLQNMSLSAATVAKLPGDALKAVYGMNEDVILYWAHHEKLCLVDSTIAFMGGLDLCYGRWDTYQSPIADCHPGNLDSIVYPGQDYNNARIMDFQDVPHWENNKLDRRENSRMGWSDISVSLHGPVVQDLRRHFIERWNFIYDEKYNVRKDPRYTRLNLADTLSQDNRPSQEYEPYKPPGTEQLYYQEHALMEPHEPNPRRHPQTQKYFPPPPMSSPSLPDKLSDIDRGLRDNQAEKHHHFPRLGDHSETLKERLEDRVQQFTEQHLHLSDPDELSVGPMTCQIVRSAAKWSHGSDLEHSISNAYIETIRQSQHFVYIENQFFITATGDKQKPIKNRVGAAIVERILRAARAGERYRIIVVIPAVPAFAGNLKDDAALGTRAIMEFQYNSINRGGYSIMEEIARAGFNPTDYIRFYNLRNYDRINASGVMQRAEKESGVDYETARREHDANLDPVGYKAQEGGDYGHDLAHQDNYKKYQQASHGNSTGDTVSECYMLNGLDIRDVPWEDGDLSEIEAFVSEELYVHSKVLIADDRVVICGSANLNDRSQLGYHDSEIAIIIQDREELQSYMSGKPWQASRFAATLRRQLFRKHLGLLEPQNMEKPDNNFHPIGVPNQYDYDSQEDRFVTDPISDEFLNFWNSVAHENTEAFAKVFHPVPHDSVRNWHDYDKFYEQYFQGSEEEAEGEKVKKPAKYKWGHVVESNFSTGEQGVKEVKEILSRIKGTLVEMPLLFLIEEDIAKEGLGLNAFTEEVYT